jgi:hypothetical protein
MKAQKQITNAAISKATTKTIDPKILDKLKPYSKVNFTVGKDINFEESEIRITIKGNDIVVKFLLKGLPVMEQVVLVKPRPTPPPIQPDDIMLALERISLKFKQVK